MALRIAVVGASGRMGHELLALIENDEALTLAAGISRTAIDTIQLSVPSLTKVPAKDVDVVVDFSQPELMSEVLNWCATNKKPLVSGVTGINDAHKSALQKAGQQTAVLWAPNMSLGVAVMAEMFSALKALNGFEFQIEEIHHKHKKDKPSGTAIFLQERLKAVVGPQVPDPLAIRGGGVFGVHKLFAMGEEEVITVEHTAINRKVFARGALIAARWLANKPAGIYKMADVLRS